MKNIKHIVALAILFMISNKVISQNDSLVILEEEIEIEDDTSKIYIFVKQMPEFPGGLTALRRWIGTHLNYPAVSRENGIQGTVYIRFEVKKDGTIGKVQIQKGVDPNFDKEVVNMIKSLPKFTPGEQNGKKVNVWFSVPINVHPD